LTFVQSISRFFFITFNYFSGITFYTFFGTLFVARFSYNEEKAWEAFL